MKKILLLILTMITILASGCNKEPEDTELIKGKEKLESHHYDEALTLLSQVLDEDPKNELARSMYMQARKMDIVEKYENNYDYEKAVKELNDIVNIDNGSKKIKRESINKKAELEKLQEEAEKQALQKKENAKKASEENAHKSKLLVDSHSKKEKEKEEKNKKTKKEKSDTTNKKDLDTNKESKDNLDTNKESKDNLDANKESKNN